MTTPAGWYPDPTDAGLLRYFDGTAWTPSTHPAGPDGVAQSPPEQPQPPVGQPVYGGPEDGWATTLGDRDVLASEPPARPGGSRVKKGLVVGVAALAVVGVAGGAFAFSTLSGGGAQPETALPASAIAYAEIDLDPAAGQKLAVYRLAKKFPKADVKGEDSVRDDLLSKAFGSDLPAGTSYEKDVKPWVGDRAGVAVLDALDADDEPQVAVAVQYDDRGSAEEHLKRLAAAGASDGEGFAYAFGAKDYVVLAETSTLAQQVVADAAKAPLSGSDRYTSAVDALGGDQIGLVWVDAKGVYDVLPKEAREAFTGGLIDAGSTPSGQVVVGVSAASDHVDVKGRVLDLQLGTAKEGSAGGRAGSGLLQDLPGDAVAAASITDAGKGLSQLYTQLKKATSDAAQQSGLGGDLFGFESSLDQYGLDLPGDLEKVFGTELAVAAVGDTPDVVARVEGGDPQRALEIIKKVDETGQSEGLVRAEGDDLVAASTPEALEAVAKGGSLGDSELFREALPEADGAGLAAFVDVQRALTAFGADDGLSAEDRADLAPLEAVGLTTQGGSDGRFLFRVTFR